MNFEQANTILNDNHVTVEFSDTFVDGAGTVTKMPEMGGWSLSWSHGVIFLGGKDFPKGIVDGLTIFISSLYCNFILFLLFFYNLRRRSLYRYFFHISFFFFSPSHYR